MAEYGEKQKDDSQHILLTGGLVAVGLFAAGRGLRPFVDKVVQEDVVRAAEKWREARKVEQKSAFGAIRRNFNAGIYSEKDTEEAYAEAREHFRFHENLQGALFEHLKSSEFKSEYGVAGALGMRFARSRAMSMVSAAADKFVPIQIADRLAFFPQLREMYGETPGSITRRAAAKKARDAALAAGRKPEELDELPERLYRSQVQKLGGLHDLGILSEEDAKLFSSESQAYYVGGKVFAVDPSKKFAVTQLKDDFFIFGHRGRGERGSVYENLRNDLLGNSNNPSELRNISAALKGKLNNLLEPLGEDTEKSFDNFRKLKKQGLLENLFTSEDIKEIKRTGYSYERIQRTLRRLEDDGAKNKFAKAMDLGLNERASGILSEEGRDKFFSTLGGQINPDDTDPLRNLRREDVKKNQYSFGVMRAFKFNELKSYRDALFGGKDGQINSGTLMSYGLFERINKSVAYNTALSGIALSSKSLDFSLGPVQFSGPAAYFSNILLKRALPIYAAGFYGTYLNDQLTDRDGRRPTDNLVLTADKADLAFAGFKDRHGITPFVKHVNELSGGALGRIAHPFTDRPVGLTQDELRQEQETGTIAVRKGRWWNFGSSTPFRGERIQYFAPNLHRQALAGDVYKTDTLYGSKDEYYQNAALPTPTAPLAPLRHFFTDRYHYEEKHYRDRPYPISSPMFEATTPWGVLLNPTLGRILKPQKLMHQDDIPFIISGPHKGEPNPGYAKKHRKDLRDLNEVIRQKQDSQELTGFVTPSGDITPMAAVSVPDTFRQIANINQESLDDADDTDAGIDDDTEIGSYSEFGPRSITPYGSGKTKYRAKLKEANDNLRLEKSGVASRFTPGRMLEPATAPGIFKTEDPNRPSQIRNMISPNDPRHQVGLGYYSATELAGIYGFGAVSMTGDMYQNMPTLANAGNMTSFERTYWDRYNSGGMLPTPGLSEAFRRFMPHKSHFANYINPIRNTMPTWLPGGPQSEDPEYFLSFTTGDPYGAIPNGEIRLPGASYEKLHDISPMNLSLRSTQVGYDQEQMYNFFTQAHTPFAAYSEEIAEKGAEAHKVALRSLKPSAENVHYEHGGIRGSVDAIVGTGSDAKAVEIHSLSDRRFREIASRPDERYERQLQVDMGALGLSSGSLVYVNRNDPTQQITVDRDFSKDKYRQVMSDVDAVRQRIVNETNQGKFGPGQFYDDVTRLEILGDVAPWSQQYKRYRDYLVHLPDEDLDPDDRARINLVKKQVTQRKKRFEMSPYKLKYAQLEYRDVHIKDVIDNNTFTTEENPDNPIRLAGVHISSDDAGNAFTEQHLRPGQLVRIGYAQDPTQRISRDSLHTIRSVVYDRSGKMINREAINSGAGTQKDENNPAGLRVQYTPQELAVGGLLENLAHLPIPNIHNKYLSIDSPLELYKRTQVYGKDWQDWKHPFRDYLFPSMESFAQQGVVGAIGAGILAHLLTTGPLWEGKFGSSNMKWNKGKLKLVGGFIAAVEAIGFYRRGDKNAVPERRKQEREINEYFDILKYVKYEGLYEKTRADIIKHEHKDIGGILSKYKNEGEARKRKIQILKAEKRKLIVGGRKKKDHERIKEINKEIRELQSYRKELNLTREDILAIQYKQVAETTLYGAEPGGDMRKVLLALNPKEREFFQQFLKAAGPERKEILKLVPENERRFLQSAYGLKPDERPNLVNYFKDHYLPPADWNGWKTEADLNDYKLVVMKQEGLDMTSQGFWPQDEERVRQEGLRNIMPFRGNANGNLIDRLRQTLGGLGLTDLDIQMTPNYMRNHQVNISVDQNQAA